MIAPALDIAALAQTVRDSLTSYDTKYANIDAYPAVGVEALLAALAAPSAGAEEIPTCYVSSHKLQGMTLGHTSWVEACCDKFEGSVPLYTSTPPDARDARYTLEQIEDAWGTSVGGFDGFRKALAAIAGRKS